MTGDALFDIYVAVYAFVGNVAPVLGFVLGVLACIALVLYIRDHWHRQNSTGHAGSPVQDSGAGVARRG